MLLTLLYACSEDEPDTPASPPVVLSSEASLLRLEITHDGNAYTTSIAGTTVSLSELLPFAAQEVSISTIEISPEASTNRETGTTLRVADSPIAIEITAEDGQSRQTYSLILETEAEPDYARLLFEQHSATTCGVYATINVGEIKVENNVWNTANLADGSYSQCVYSYEQGDLQLAGWQWEYPDNARGVNAYPQLIYGFKPWQPPSTTQKLPRKLADISRLKGRYEAEVDRNDGDYNLAFDNWINASANITPQNIQFEFMIWEDANNLVPFGDFQEVVNTSNGIYRFYMGEPDWEPAGTNWTYLAFQRTSNRSQGVVDIDELLTYLINAGIVSEESYLASLELGNEVGNSTGQTIIKAFEVEID